MNMKVTPISATYLVSHVTSSSLNLLICNIATIISNYSVVVRTKGGGSSWHMAPHSLNILSSDG